MSGLQGPLSSRALGWRGTRGPKMYGFPPSPLSFTVNLPDTLHCGNISVIPTTSCNEDYPGRVKDTMVCAGVEGGGTDSCEVRARGSHGGRADGGGQVWELGWGRVLLALGQRRCYV